MSHVNDNMKEILAKELADYLNRFESITFYGCGWILQQIVVLNLMDLYLEYRTIEEVEICDGGV